MPAIWLINLTAYIFLFVFGFMCMFVVKRFSNSTNKSLKLHKKL